MQLKKELMYLGLTEKQSLLYIWLLENGKGNVRQMAREIGYSRPTIYTLIEELKIIGLIIENHGALTTYSPQPPSKLISVLDEKKREAKHKFDEENILIDKKKDYLNNIMSKLVLTHSNAPNNPKVRFFEGEIGIENIRQEIIEEHLSEDFYEIFNYDSMKKGEEQEKWQKERTKGKGKQTSLCTSEKIESEQVKNIGNAEFNIIPAKDNPFFTEIMTYDYKTIITSLKETKDDNIFGIIIEDKNITGTIKNLIKQYLNK